MSFMRSPPNVLLVSQDTMQNMDGREALAGLWFLFTKCKNSLADGGRLENVSWRLWHREFTTNALTTKLSSPPIDSIVNEKGVRNQPQTQSRPLTPESANGSDRSSEYTDEKQAYGQPETVVPARPHRKIGQVIWEVSNSPPLPPSPMVSFNRVASVPTYPPTPYAEPTEDHTVSSLPTPDTEKEVMASIAVQVVPPPSDATTTGSVNSGTVPAVSRATTSPSSNPSTAPPSRAGTAPSTPRSTSRVGSPNTSLYPRLVIVNPTPHPTPPATPISVTNGNGHLLDVNVQGNSLRPPVPFNLPSEPTPERNEAPPKGIFFVPNTKDKGSGSSSSGSSSGSSALSTTIASGPSTTTTAAPSLLPAAPINAGTAGKAAAERSIGKQPTVESTKNDESAFLSSEDEEETQVEEEETEDHRRLVEEARKNRKKPVALMQRNARSKSRGRDFGGHGGAIKRFAGGRGHPQTRKDSTTSKFHVGSGDSGSRSKSPGPAFAGPSRVQPVRAQQLKPKFNVGSDSASPGSPQVSPARPSPPAPPPPAMARHVSAPLPPPTHQAQQKAAPAPQTSRTKAEPNKANLPRAMSSRTGLGGMNLRMTAANPPSNLRATATRTEPPTRNSSQTALHRALPPTTTADGLAAAAALVQKQQEEGGNRSRVELTSESDESSSEGEDDEEWTSATGSDEDEVEGEEGEPQTVVQQQAPPAPVPAPAPPLMRRQTTATNVSRMQRAKSAASALTQEEKLKQAALEAQRQRDMFAKLPKRSYSNLNRTGSGLLTQLMNPDPEIFPVNHPYRRGHSTGDVDSTHGAATRAPLANPGGLTLLKEAANEQLPPARAPAPAPAPQRPTTLRKTSTASSRGFLMPSLTSKVAVAGPVAAQVHAGSVSRPSMPKHSREVSGGYRPKGRPESQEMESSDEEDEQEGNKAVGNLSQSVAQQRLQALAQRRGASTSSRKGKESVRSPQDQLPPWAVDEDLPPSPEEAPPTPTTATAPMPAAAQPIRQLSYPYNLPQHAEPSTPRTTRQLMLRTEMSESVRQNLLWQRHMSKADMLGPQRRSSANLPSMLTRSNPQNKSVVEVRPKKKTPAEMRRQSVENERREVEEFVTGRKSTTNLQNAEEESSDRMMLGARPPIARHKSWAYQDR